MIPPSAAANAPVIEKKKPGRKRTRVSKIQALLNNLPQGFTFNGQPEQCTERYIMASLSENLLAGNQEDQAIAATKRLELTEAGDSRTFRVGFFSINIDQARVQDLKAMRKLLPRVEYKLLKNRKCARLSRSRRKEQTSALIEQNRLLMEENARLRRQLGLPPANYNDSLTVSDSSDKECDSNGADPGQDGIRVDPQLQELTEEAPLDVPRSHRSAALDAGAN